MRGKGKIAVLVSGGADSAVLLAWACARFRQVYPLYVRCGMRWEEAELFWLKRFLRQFHPRALQGLSVLDMPVKDSLPGHWGMKAGRRVPGYRSQDEAVFIPGRNLLLLSKAAVFCYAKRIGRVALGTLKANPFADGSLLFFRAFEKAAGRGLGMGLKVHAPFRNKDKAAILRMGQDLPLQWTFSCLQPRGHKICGRCNKCAERHKAISPAML